MLLHLLNCMFASMEKNRHNFVAYQKWSKKQLQNTDVINWILNLNL